MKFKRILLGGIILVLVLLATFVYGVIIVGVITPSPSENLQLPIGDPSVIVKNSTNGLFAIISDGALITSDIQLGRSDDDGATWNLTLIDTNPTVACESDLSIIINSSDGLHVFCSRNSLQHWASVDSGATWTARQEIFDDTNIYFAAPTINSQDDLILCFINSSNVHMVTSSTSGQTWSGGTTINTGVGSSVTSCDIEVDSNDNTFITYWLGAGTDKNLAISNATLTNLATKDWTAVNITDVADVPLPSIAITSTNNISIAWQFASVSGTFFNLSYANSSDGVTWSVNKSIMLSDQSNGGVSLVRDRLDNMHVIIDNLYLNLTANESIFSGWSADYIIPHVSTSSINSKFRGSTFPTFNSFDNISESIDFIYIAINESTDPIWYSNLEIGRGDAVDVILVSPPTANFTTETTIDFNCTASTSLGANIDNVTFLLYDSTPTLEVSTFRDLTNDVTQSESFNVVALTDDAYAWNCQYTDVNNLLGFQGSNNTVTIDNTDPNSLNIILQSNISLSTSVELNYTFNESNPDACIFSLDDGVTNTSFASCGTNATMTAPFGDNTVIIYVNDTTGHQISASQDFTVITQNFTANRNVSEATTQVFNFIVYNGSSILDSAALTYNNTNVGYDSFISNGTALNFTKTLTTDLLIDFQNFTEIQYFWNSTFFVGNDFINLTSGLQVQEVHRQLVVDCSDPTANLITLNFTAVDEDTNVRQNLSGELEFLVWNEIKGSGRTYNFNYLNSSNLTETTTCIYPDWNELNSDIRFVYRNDLYPTREYNALSLLLTNSTNAITLFMGLVSSSTEIQVEIRDQNDNDLIGYLIEAYEFDLGNGSFALKDSETSNFDGLVYFNLDVTNTLWQFRVKDSEGVQIWDSGAPFELQETTYLYRLPIGLIRPSQDILAIDAFIQRAFLDYANSTRRITYSWTNTSQMGDTCLTVYNRTQGGDTIISNQCSSLNNGTLNYTLGADWDGYFVGIANVSLLTKVGDFLTYQVDSKYMDLREALLKFGREGLLYAAIIIGSLASVGIAIGSGTIAILLMIVGLMATTAIGFISVGWTLTMGMIVIGFFIILKISRG